VVVLFLLSGDQLNNWINLGRYDDGLPTRHWLEGKNATLLLELKHLKPQNGSKGFLLGHFNLMNGKERPGGAMSDKPGNDQAHSQPGHQRLHSMNE